MSTITVAVLNSSYEPLSPTKLGRAVALVASGRAMVDEAHANLEVRSAGGLQIPVPKVIRLISYLKVDVVYEKEVWTREGVLRRDKNACAYCGKSFKIMTLDHVFPKSRFIGNANTWENTVAACVSCNNIKADRTPSEAGMYMRIDPHAPMKPYLRSGKKHSKKKR